MADINKIIKDARNVLVGKVPDPQSQIDQITLALIYKFMDAKDGEAIALGIEPQFFVGKNADYSFSKIMHASSNPEQYELYTKGIDMLQTRTDLPETFVNVFKDAFVPYKDARTLHLFLEEINKIPTDNTELLGTAFEDLLSIMGSQGDAGMFRTPRHIINMIVDIVEPKKDDSILDPACGTAGFLISAYNKISKQDLTIEEREKLINEGLVGYDINPNMVKLSHVNLFLHGCKKPNIHLYDTLTERDFWKDNYDVILANPPFMTPKGGIKPHELFSAINANRSEVLFTYYIAKHLKRDGRAGIIVPEGVVFQSANAYKNLRKMLVEENYLYAVISLPAGVFNPYSGVKTSVLLFDKALAKRTDKILFVKMNNDGYDLGAQRRKIEKDDIPTIVDIIKRFAFCVATESEDDFVDNSGLSIMVNKKQIAENDYILVGDRYKTSKKSISTYKMIPLNQVLDYEQPTKYIVNSVNYSDEYNTPVLTAGKSFILGYTDEKENIYKDVPVIIFDDFTTDFKYVDFPFKVKSSAMKILKCKNNALIKYVYYIMQNIKFDSSIHKRYWISEYSNIEIPLPSIEVQEQIVYELDSYQKIIDGARQIVDNYKPKINVDHSWELKKLSDVCDVRDGTHESPKYVNNGIPLITSKNVYGGEIDFSNVSLISEDDYNKIKIRSNVEVGDILMPMIGTIGRPVIVKTEKRFAIKNVALIKCGKLVLNDYVLYILEGNVFQKYIDLKKRGGTQNFIALGDIRDFKIPVPSIEIQHLIVNSILEEVFIVEQNKRLIEIFENKIKAKINEIWGKEDK